MSSIETGGSVMEKHSNPSVTKYEATVQLNLLP
jgi:hypothetical protein